MSELNVQIKRHWLCCSRAWTCLPT